MELLLQEFGNLFDALIGVTLAVVQLFQPWVPLLLWVVFWCVLVDWRVFRRQLKQGGWIPLALLFFLGALFWSLLDPTASGRHTLFGLSASNLVGKIVYVSGLACLMFVCGSFQLASGLRPSRYPQ